MSTYTWRYEGADGTVMQGADLPTTGYPNQADAETWIGESWRSLLAAGVEHVSLLRDDDIVYRAMSLRPVE